jgi:hypothetical protein
MAFDFTHVNWLYLGLAVAVWGIAVVAIWRKGNPSLLEQHVRFGLENPEARLQFDDWLSMGPPGHAPVTPGRRTPIIQLIIAFWGVLLVMALIFGVIRVL